LLVNLKGKTAHERHAEFHCVLAFVLHADDPIPLICEGRWKGEILTSPRGEAGFGYDPVFYIANEQKTAAELSPEIKNTISHRGRALQVLLKQLPEKLCMLSQ